MVSTAQAFSTPAMMLQAHTYHHAAAVIAQLTKQDLKGAKVMLINMPIREQARPNNAPLGLALLAARLQQYEVDVVILDLNAYRLCDKDQNDQQQQFLTPVAVESMIYDYLSHYGDQDLIAMSGLITTLNWQQQVARIVRKYQPQAMLASGGGLATEFRGVLFDWIPELDAVAHSEGDDVILKMAFDAKLMRNSQTYPLQQLKPYFLAEISGRKKFYYDGGRPADLDALPLPAWDLFATDIYGNAILENYLQTPIWGISAQNSSATPFVMHRSLNTVSSRGCPYACRFCFRGAQGERNYGIRSADNIAAEIEHYAQQYQIDFLGFLDDNFAVDRKRIQAFAKDMQPVLEKHQVKWGTHARLDEAADIKAMHASGPELRQPLRVQQMADAGCAYIGFGAESASESVLNAMGKGGFILKWGTEKINGYHLPVSMTQGIRNCYNAGIHANCTWIMGYPGERLEDLQTSIAFIQWQEELYTKNMDSTTESYAAAKNSVNKNLFIATAYPGTEMFKHPHVQQKLQERFNLQFDSQNGAVIPDKALMQYVQKLNDASDVIYDNSGVPLNYGEMDLETFMQVRNYIESGDIYKILDL